MRRRALSMLAGGLLVAVALGGAGAGCMSAAPRAPDLRTADGRLAPCPESPNCVCSEAPAGAAGGSGKGGTGATPAGAAGAGTGGAAATPADPAHAIAPLAFRGAPEAAWAELAALLEGWPRARTVFRTGDYLHAEFTSLVFRFVDDVEFRLDAAAGVIQVRSASRVGYSDLGANRRRIEELRAAFEARMPGGFGGGR